MTFADITRYRLHRQQLVNSGYDKPGDVVAWLGAVQAQEYNHALWSIAQRMNVSAEEPDVEKALSDRSIIRTWPMRGTLHFVAAKDARWMLKYLTPRVVSRAASIYKQAGLDKKVFAKSRKLWIKALEGGNPLTRDEMYAVLEQGKISAANTRGLHMLGNAAMEGVICFGARKGKQQTFALLDEWIPPYRVPPKEEALAELALRYFKSHGPATLEDFMWWAGLPKNEAAPALEAVKPQLEDVTIQSNTYWLDASGDPGKINTSTAYLLPTYDEYGIAYKDRSAIIHPSDHKKVGGTFTSGIVINGKVAGIWRRSINKDTVEIETKAFGAFSEKQTSAIKAAAKRYSKFLGLSLAT